MEIVRRNLSRVARVEWLSASQSNERLVSRWTRTWKLACDTNGPLAWRNMQILHRRISSPGLRRSESVGAAGWAWPRPRGERRGGERVQAPAARAQHCASRATWTFRAAGICGGFVGPLAVVIIGPLPLLAPPAFQHSLGQPERERAANSAWLNLNERPSCVCGRPGERTSTALAQRQRERRSLARSQVEVINKSTGKCLDVGGFWRKIANVCIFLMSFAARSCQAHALGPSSRRLPSPCKGSKSAPPRFGHLHLEPRAFAHACSRRCSIWRPTVGGSGPGQAADGQQWRGDGGPSTGSPREGSDRPRVERQSGGQFGGLCFCGGGGGGGGGGGRDCGRRPPAADEEPRRRTKVATRGGRGERAALHFD